ncbi:hypothetical protein Tco_0035256, partial [Tanacetum coccineum]
RSSDLTKREVFGFASAVNSVSKSSSSTSTLVVYVCDIKSLEWGSKPKHGRFIMKDV